MGLSFRKSIKIGKNTRINLSKTGGVGISTGVKGFRVSTNKRGSRITASSNGIQYRKDFSKKRTPKNDNATKKVEDMSTLEPVCTLIKGIVSLIFYGGLLFLIIKFILAIF